MNGQQAPRIIVKRKAGHGGGHHGGAWKVAYADFVTAMMALFIVLWLLSSSTKVQRAVGGFFQDPTGAGRMAGSTKAGSGEDMGVHEDDMQSLKKKIEAAMAKEIENFEQLKQNMQITITQEGLRVELLESERGFFFESGRFAPTRVGDEVLAMLGRQLGALPNKVVIEGHTDARPYGSDAAYTNWELSSDRSNAARRVMRAHGLRDDQVVQVRGFADQHLLKADKPEDPSNRRVSVIVRFSDLTGDSEQRSKTAESHAAK